MPKQIIIAEQHRIAAVFSEDQIQELVVATGNHQVGDIYLGVVENVLPGIDAAFVNIGDPERNGFIHVSDLGPLRLKRTAGAITELLAPQQKVLVQVMKEPTGNKGPRLTGNITLPGRYLVLMPFGRGVNLSRRIKSESERNRLRALAILLKPPGMGLLVRTEAENKPEEAIIEDLESLQKQWEAIQQEVISSRAPALLNRDDDFVQRVLRDMYSEDVNRIVVDSHTGVKRVKQHLINWSAGKTPQGVLIDHHRDRLPILDYFRVNAAIREALKPRVDLPSGGYIIIEPTEALTVIDVNSGSFTRSATARETVLWTNCEAATEIARQLKLRNLAGVIIVDFIDMDSRRDQLQVLEHFNKALKADKARPQIAQLSELGLVELTRKRQGQNIYELFGRLCPTCGGLGHVVHLPGENITREREIFDTEARRWTETSSEEIVSPRHRVNIPSATGISESSRERLPEREPAPSSSFRDYPTVEPTRAPIKEIKSVPIWEDKGYTDDFDSNVDYPDADMLNHPDLKDRGGLNNARRRRRRRLISENERLEENMGRGSTSSSTSFSGASESGWVAEPEMPTPTSKSFPNQVSKNASLLQKGIRLDSSDRYNRPTKEVAPSEVISVEMTPEEQEVYALMGISPLLLLDREVKNPKTATVSIKLPGKSDSTTSSDEALRYRSDSYRRNDVTDDEETGDDEPENYQMELDFSEDSAPEEERTIEPPVLRRESPEIPTPESSESESESIDPSDPSDSSDSSDSSVRRRRRRRSSALENDGGS
ncbi:ribonuclease E/G [Aerosakkonemataceae cyanobacterium BLCC-F154]|uniref:Ribonuclease E/G n=1 Tax=Floridaenema fluviatile BLCC-F154 TaxID=3153640 RepID=A0ABV4Y8P8_9CYAN